MQRFSKADRPATVSPLAPPTAANAARSAAPDARAIVRNDFRLHVHGLVLSTERSVDDSEMMVAGSEVHAGDAEHLSKSFGGDLHRAGGGSAAGRGLRERRGHRGMEGDVALHLLHHLVNVPVEHGDRAEALQDRESLRAVLGAPAPFGVNGPQRNVREDDNRRAGGEVGDVLAEPFQLLRADLRRALPIGRSC